MSSGTFWKRIGLHDWFLKKEAIVETAALTPDGIYKYIVEKFEESISQLSFAGRVVFYHEYIICFSPPDYNEFMENKKGIFGLIIQESVKTFYSILTKYRQQGKTVSPSGNKWVFRFVSHPDYAKGDKSFIGKLLPGNPHQKEENLRVTFIPRQTGIAQTFDINEEILKDFTFYSEGYYEVPYQENLLQQEGSAIKTDRHLARFETTVPDKQYSGKKLEYLMNDDDITISGQEEKKDQPGIFRIPSEWVSTPHLRIRYDKNENKFYLASFGEKTILNENEVPSSKIDTPSWVDLPVNSKIVLNGIVGINIFKG
ncbi:MAG TPA: hypothetical protein VK498_10835 [Ferruginibacter sp.]|nr:hypothetical protein [Ferruginibacter sp.]